MMEKYPSKSTIQKFLVLIYANHPFFSSSMSSAVVTPTKSGADCSTGELPFEDKPLSVSSTGTECSTAEDLGLGTSMVLGFEQVVAVWVEGREDNQVGVTRVFDTRSERKDLKSLTMWI